jgi:cation diffusion facilitator family transporter
VLTEWLVRRFVSTPGNVSDPRTREAYGLLEGWASVVINLVLFAVKLIPGLIIGSITLVADALHSLGDLLGSGVIIWGFKAAARPSDAEHPFGHGRVESIATLVVGILLFVAAWEIGQNSVLRLLHPHPVHASVGLLLALTATLPVKEWLSRFARDLGGRIDSSALKGDFLHHRSDAIATGVVIASLIAGRFGLDWVDGVGGLAVAAFIAAAAYALTRDALDPLIGQAPSPQLVSQIRATALAVPGVDEVHEVIVHWYGGFLVTSLHIEVSDALDLTSAHELAEAAENALTRRFPGQAVVHVDPVNRAHPLYAAVHSFLAATVPTVAGAQEFHALRIVGHERPCSVIFDLKADSGQAPAAAAAIRDALTARFPEVAKVVVNIGPRFVY